MQNVWVNSDWKNLKVGDKVTVGTKELTYGTDAFSTLQEGADSTDAGGTVTIYGGSGYTLSSIKDNVKVDCSGLATDVTLEYSASIAGTGFFSNAANLTLGVTAGNTLTVTNSEIKHYVTSSDSAAGTYSSLVLKGTTRTSGLILSGTGKVSIAGKFVTSSPVSLNGQSLSVEDGSEIIGTLLLSNSLTFNNASSYTTSAIFMFSTAGNDVVFNGAQVNFTAQQDFLGETVRVNVTDAQIKAITSADPLIISAGAMTLNQRYGYYVQGGELQLSSGNVLSEFYCDGKVYSLGYADGFFRIVLDGDATADETKYITAVKDAETGLASGRGEELAALGSTAGTYVMTLATDPVYYNRGSELAHQTFTGSALWMTGGTELFDALKNSGKTGDDLDKYSVQLLGMPPTSINSTRAVAEISVSSNYLMRAAKAMDTLQKIVNSYDPSTASFTAYADLTDSGITKEYYDAFCTWFSQNAASAYGTTGTQWDWRSPWTQYGYTYDWSDTAAADHKGLAEYMLLGQNAGLDSAHAAQFDVVGVYHRSSYIYRTLVDGEPVAATANYTVTGSCEAVWAGTFFAKYGDTISLESAGSVGGEGIYLRNLSTSDPAYTVTVAGSITADGSLKYDYSDSTTAWSAIYSDHAKADITVTGTISAISNAGGVYGTAVKAAAGSDASINLTVNGGTIRSDTAFLGGSGSDSVTIKSGSTVKGTLDGGSGTDTLLLDGFSGGLDGAANFEYVTTSNGAAVTLPYITTKKAADTKISITAGTSAALNRIEGYNTVAVEGTLAFSGDYTSTAQTLLLSGLLSFGTDSVFKVQSVTVTSDSKITGEGLQLNNSLITSFTVNSGTTLTVTDSQFTQLALADKFVNDGTIAISGSVLWSQLYGLDTSAKLGTVTVTGYVTDVHSMKVGNSKTLSLSAAAGIIGTNRSDSISLGSNSVVSLGNVDLAGGSNRLTVGWNAYFEASTLTDIRYFTASSGRTYRNASNLRVQGWTTAVIEDNYAGISGTNSFVLGNCASVSVGNSLFLETSGRAAVRIGRGSTLTVGNTAYIHVLSMSSGLVVTKNSGTKILAETSLSVTGTAWGSTGNDTWTLSSLCSMTAGTIDMQGGSNRINVGHDSTISAGSVSNIGVLSLSSSNYYRDATGGKVMGTTSAKFDKYTGTAGNDTISLSNGSVLEITDSLDLLAGRNTVNVYSGSSFTADGSVTGVTNLNMRSGTAKKFTSAVVKGAYVTNDGSSVITTGNYTSLELRSGVSSSAAAGRISIRAGTAATIRITGNASNIYQLRAGSGRDAITLSQILIDGSVAGTTGNDSVTGGKFAKVTVSDDLDLGDGRDTISLGDNSQLRVCGNFRNVEALKLGKSSSAELSTEGVTELQSTAKISLGKNSRVYDIGAIGIASAFTDLKTENADNSLESESVLSSGANGWLSNKTQYGDILTYTDAIDYFTLTNASSLEGWSIAGASGTLTVKVWKNFGSGWEESETVKESAGTWNLGNVSVANCTEWRVSVQISDTAQSGIYGYTAQLA